ncbi:hypothetical protein BEL04_20350 [Mucilaginibacter sp. PPCGB 2223]|uniref:Abi-alpha family protein n=1 Tax=Mucilaginibacter sp. PPCGB 2223 TaxID=1886027 RepID=UPI000823FFE6|nr:Abi-alpha family protein [Mucilaginibacter sp. PPCGB 2223]OCX51070.1 hypothetical protein BEL04_20350 [Mucilaginibacter sp. PPCGB 2223]
MGEKHLNIKSSTIEKGLDLAKSFLEKLIFPTIEEVGLLIADNIKLFRYKNQIKILLKAEKYVADNNIKIKEIPTKILVPLLENASLEDNEDLQDKWAKMIANMADSDSNLQNQIFPYILSQISINEYNELKELSLGEYKFKLLRNDYSRLIRKDKYGNAYDTQVLRQDINKIEQEGFDLNLVEYEAANLIRLGLVKQLPPTIIIDEFKTGGENVPLFDEQWHMIGAQYDQDDNGYRITELGERFLQICEISKK